MCVNQKRMEVLPRSLGRKLLPEDAGVALPQVELVIDQNVLLIGRDRRE